MNAQNEMATPMFAKLSDLSNFSEEELLKGCCTQGCCNENPILIDPIGIGF
jgi:hypothetical protein